MKRLWKIIKSIGANLPFFLCLGAAFYFGYILDDRHELHFWIIMAALYMVLRECYEIRQYLKKLFEDVTAEAEAAAEEEAARANTDELPLQSGEIQEIRVILERLLEDEEEPNRGRHGG